MGEEFVLFVCVGNVGRSQMAEAYFNKFAKTHKAKSAGIGAAHHMSDTIIKLMNEEGIDIRGQSPKQLTSDFVESASKIIAMGDDVKKSDFLAVKVAENWHVPDPARVKTIEEIKEIRDMIKVKVLELVKELE